MSDKLAQLKADLICGRGHGSPNCSTDDVLALIAIAEAARDLRQATGPNAEAFKVVEAIRLDTALAAWEASQ